MSTIKNTEIEEHLRRAAEALTPDAAEKIWEKPVEKAEMDDWFLDGTHKSRTRAGRYYRWASLAAACFVIVILSWFQIYRRVDAQVYLDVNPGVCVEVSRGGRVLRAQAENRDGEVILEDMDLRNVDIDVAVNALLGSMVRHGYLTDRQNVVLVSVEGRKALRAQQLSEKVSQDVQETLAALLGEGIVLYQSVEMDDEIARTAGEYGLTPGKASLILRLMEKVPGLDLSDLTAMPVEDLVRLGLRCGIDIRQCLRQGGGVLGDLSTLQETGEKQDADGPSASPGPAGKHQPGSQEDLTDRGTENGAKNSGPDTGKDDPDEDGPDEDPADAQDDPDTDDLHDARYEDGDDDSYDAEEADEDDFYNAANEPDDDSSYDAEDVEDDDAYEVRDGYEEDADDEEDDD